MEQYYKQYIEPLLTERTSQIKNGYVVYYASKNEVLFRRLYDKGFFNFHETNQSMHIVSEHQIVAFFDYGYKALANKFKARRGEIEIHHINGITTDNRPENLVYLSCHDHKFVSAASNTPFVTREFDVMTTPFNKQGKRIKNHLHFMTSALVRTISAVKYQAKGILSNVWNYVVKSLPRWMKLYFSNKLQFCEVTGYPTFLIT